MIGSRARGLLNDPAVPGKGWEGCYDLTGPRSLVCIAGELRARQAARNARAARWRRSWLFRLVSRLRDWRARWDRGVAGRSGPIPPLPAVKTCPGCGCGLPIGPALLCSACELVDREMAADVMQQRLAEIDAHELLSIARAAALRDGRKDLAAAVHALVLLDLTGNLEDIAPLVAAVRSGMERAMGVHAEEPRGVN